MKEILVKHSIKAILVFGMIISPTVQAVKIADLDVTLSGYVKADFIYDTKQDQGDLSFSGSLVPGLDDEAHFRAHARETRIRLSAKKDDFKFVVEGDFFGGTGNETVSNSRGFRLRHAYGQKGNWMAGQNWSTFMDFMTFPKLVDFGTGPGVSFIRQAQIRYTQGGLSVALENPEVKVGENLNAIEKTPDLIVKYRYPGNGIGFYAAGLFKRLEASDAVGRTDSVLATALHAGVAFKLGENSTLGFNTILGAPGRYSQEKWFSPDAYINANGELDTVDSKSFQITYKHKLHNGSLNIDYGMLDIDDESGLAVGTFDEVSEIHLNRIWNIDNIEYAVEVARSDREDFNGVDVDNVRIQAAIKYKF